MHQLCNQVKDKICGEKLIMKMFYLLHIESQLGDRKREGQRKPMNNPRIITEYQTQVLHKHAVLVVLTDIIEGHVKVLHQKLRHLLQWKLHLQLRLQEGVSFHKGVGKSSLHQCNLHQ